MTPPDRTRCNHASLDLVREFRVLRDRGYSAVQAADKSNYCSKSYRFRIFNLLEHGDPRLIEDVEQGRIPLTVATHIARVANLDLQIIFADGYKAGTVSGTQINTMRQIIDQHESEKLTPSIHSASATLKRSRTVAADALIRHFRNETDKQRLVVKKAKLARSRLVFIVGALKKLFYEDPFVALMGAEGIRTMPTWLVERINDQANDA
jgi:ParB family chromosome partitioning protein